MQKATLTDSALQKTLKKDKELLEKTRLPIITVSASYQEDLKGFHQLPEEDITPDIVYSRAHYSMALAVAVQAWENKINPEKAWVVDPTNYVAAQDWSSVTFTETVGKMLARTPLLKKLKDLADRFARNKLPILSSITPPLLYLTQDISRPILSLHIASGNILAELGKTTLQVVTDPHVREDYLNQAERENMYFLVFDQQTKLDFIAKAEELNKKINQNRIIVSGPPVDPRIIQNVQKKQIWQNTPKDPKPIKLCLTTGGLGTNKGELKTILDQLLPLLHQKPLPYQLLVYASTHLDFLKMVQELASKHNLTLNEIGGHDPAEFSHLADLAIPHSIKQHQPSLQNSPLSVIYHPQIVDANELLTHLAFPWADGFISKPSGDMAYDAVLSGSFLLTLQEWGEWEHNIRKIFEVEGVAKPAQVKNITEQLEILMTPTGQEPAWITQAMSKTKQLDPLFFSGTKNIVESYRKIAG